MNVKQQYKIAWQLARCLANGERKVKALENRGEYTRAKTMQLNIWQQYERTCWVVGVSYKLAWKARAHLAAREN